MSGEFKIHLADEKIIFVCDYCPDSSSFPKIMIPAGTEAYCHFGDIRLANYMGRIAMHTNVEVAGKDVQPPRPSSAYLSVPLECLKFAEVKE